MLILIVQVSINSPSLSLITGKMKVLKAISQVRFSVRMSNDDLCEHAKGKLVVDNYKTKLQAM